MGAEMPVAASGVQRLRTVCAQAAKQHRLVITGHERADVDSVVSCLLMKRLLAAWDLQCAVVLHAPDGQARRVMARFGVDVQALAGETTPEDALILVDHHRTERDGQVVACVDHHPTDYPPAYPYVQLGDSGACAVMVLRLMREAAVPVSALEEQMAVAALYLDTIALRSAKISPEEAAWGEREARRLGLDEDWLLREGMGLQDMRLPAGKLALLGRKTYTYGTARVLSSYVQTDAMTPEKLSDILSVLQAELRDEQADRWVFLVHDPVRMRSAEYDLTPDGQIRTIAYDYLASRGRDVMPRVEREMRQTLRKDEEP